jgi:hypothetical protein
MFLADDIYVCVFCDRVSTKGIVVTVDQHRFFACAACLQLPLLLLAFAGERIAERIATGNDSSSDYCVACGRSGMAGYPARVGVNWFNLCQDCLQNVIPDVVIEWADFGQRRRPEHTFPFEFWNGTQERLDLLRKIDEEIRDIDAALWRTGPVDYADLAQPPAGTAVVDQGYADIISKLKDAQKVRRGGTNKGAEEEAQDK